MGPVGKPQEHSPSPVRRAHTATLTGSHKTKATPVCCGMRRSAAPVQRILLHPPTGTALCSIPYL